MAKVPKIIPQMVVKNGDESHAKREKHTKRKNTSLRKSQQTPGTYPRYPKIQIWKDFLHKQVVEGLGYVLSESGMEFSFQVLGFG